MNPAAKAIIERNLDVRMSASPKIKELIKRHLKVVSWEDTCARVECPSGANHPDCLVYYSNLLVDDFHETCASQRRDLTAQMQAEAGDDLELAQALKKVEADPVVVKWRAHLRKIEVMARHYKLPTIPEIPVSHWLKTSPVPVADMDDHQQFVAVVRGLFYGQEKYSLRRLIWTGNKTDSGTEEASVNFKEAQAWVQQGYSYGQFLGLHIFTSATNGERTRHNVLLKYFDLAESDTLSMEKFGGVIQYIQQYFPLRALVLTGGRTAHAVFDWFLFKDHNKTQEFRRILAGLGCDPKMLTGAMMCRCPGQERLDKETGAPTGRFHRLIYLNPVCPEAYANH